MKNTSVSEVGVIRLERTTTCTPGNGIGPLHSITNSGLITISYIYSSLGHLQTKTKIFDTPNYSNTFDFNYSYDQYGRISRVTYL